VLLVLVGMHNPYIMGLGRDKELVML